MWKGTKSELTKLIADLNQKHLTVKFKFKKNFIKSFQEKYNSFRYEQVEV